MARCARQRKRHSIWSSRHGPDIHGLPVEPATHSVRAAASLSGGGAWSSGRVRPNGDRSSSPSRRRRDRERPLNVDSKGGPCAPLRLTPRRSGGSRRPPHVAALSHFRAAVALRPHGRGSGPLPARPRNDRYPPHFFPTGTESRKVQQRVVLTRSLHHLAMTAICAQRTAGVDVNRTL